MTGRPARARRIAAGLWTRLEWLLSAAAAPLAVVWMRQSGVEAGLVGTALVIAGLAFTLFELHRPQQWRLLVLSLRLRRSPRDPNLIARLWLALHDLPSQLARGVPLDGLDDEEAIADELAARGLFARPPARVRAIFAAALAERSLSPAGVKLVLSTDVEVARTRDAGGFHLVELHPATAAGPSSLLRGLLTHELAHVAHRDPTAKRVLCGILVPLCTLLAALSAGLIEGRSDSAAPLAVAVALLASATLLPWAYASLQAVSFALELRADREAAALCGTQPVFELLDCLDEGGQPYRARRTSPARPAGLVERETNRLLEEVLYLLPAHPPTWERRRRMLAIDRPGARSHGFRRDALPGIVSGTAPLVVALLLAALAFELAGPEQLRPLRTPLPPIERLASRGGQLRLREADLGCGRGGPLCADALEAALAKVAPRPQREARK